MTRPLYRDIGPKPVKRPITRIPDNREIHRDQIAY